MKNGLILLLLALLIAACCNSDPRNEGMTVDDNLQANGS